MKGNKKQLEKYSEQKSRVKIKREIKRLDDIQEARTLLYLKLC